MKFDVLQPVQDEQRPLGATQFAQRDRQAILAWIAAEFAQHERGGHGAVLNR